MKLAEYASYDALGLAALVAEQASVAERARGDRGGGDRRDQSRRQRRRRDLSRPHRGLDERRLGDGPFRGVPFLMKDVFGHEAGRKIEFGSRLCRGMIAQQDTHLCELFRAAGVNILGRSAAPEYSMSGTTEGALYGNTSTPWRAGYSAGGSTGGGMAAVIAGMVPIAHGSDIGGSMRIPASFCGGVGLQAVARARVVRPDGGRERLRPRAELRAGEERARRRGDARLPCGSAARRSVRHSEGRRRSYAALGGDAAAATADRLVDRRADGFADRRRGGERRAPTSRASWPTWDTT